MGWAPGVRAAFLWGASQDAPGGGRPRLRDRLVHRSLYLPAGDLSPEKIDRHLHALRRFRPKVLQAYPSAADLLARRLLERGERLDVPVVLLTAEPVRFDQRERVTQAFQAEVFTFYGARECGWIASECALEHRLHVNTACVLLEEEDGALLVTDLVNHAMPLIRYEIGDRGALAKEPCPCGDPRPVLERLDGRENDVFALPSGRRVPGVALDRWLRWGTGVVEWQLVQREPDALDVRYVPSASFGDADLETLRRRLDEAFGGELRLRFHRVERIEPGRNGKVRACLVELPDLARS
jgi:phenylacetate-CoA ligase